MADEILFLVIHKIDRNNSRVVGVEETKQKAEQMAHEYCATRTRASMAQIEYEEFPLGDVIDLYV